ncbi:MULTISPECIES: hypothetical protein [unclassified Carboxylicivirga]|uniref:hypothetical protein n=1 Tax=Carboxylicivirga TaxID=1628153 RepID=UPI003D33BB6E
MSAQKTLKQIRLIYFIVVILLAVFAALSFVFITMNGRAFPMDPGAENNLKSLIIVLALAGIPASYMFHNRKVKHINQGLSTEQKLQQYRMAYFIKIMTLEGISLLSLLAYLMIGNINQIMIFGLVYLFLVLNYPKKSSIFEELNIDASDL